MLKIVLGFSIKKRDVYLWYTYYSSLENFREGGNIIGKLLKTEYLYLERRSRCISSIDVKNLRSLWCRCCSAVADELNHGTVWVAPLPLAESWQVYSFSGSQVEVEINNVRAVLVALRRAELGSELWFKEGIGRNSDGLPIDATSIDAFLGLNVFCHSLDDHL